MRLLAPAVLLVVAACSSEQPARKQPAPAPSAPPPSAPAADPWNAPANAAVGSAGDPAWAKDPPDVLRAKINGVNAHVVVLKYTADFAEYRDVLRVVEKVPGVVAAEPFIMAELEIEKPGKPPQHLTLKAVDPARVGRVLTVGRHMNAGTLDSLGKGDPPPIVIGDVLARWLDVAIGDVVTVRPRKDSPDPMPAATPARFRVGGTFHMDFDVYDEMLGVAPLAAVQAMLGRGDQVMGVELVVNDLAASDEVAEAVDKALGGPPYKVMDWYALNEQLFKALGHARP